MNKLQQLIQELCPDGVEWKTLGKVAKIKTGQAVNKQMISDYSGEYPVINSGREPLGFINKWNTENDPIGITTRGAGVGSVTWQEGRYFRGNLNYSVTINNKSKIEVRFLYHLLLEMQPNIQSLCVYDGIPALNASSLNKLQIPIPPLPVQTEIVRILDKFSALTAELKAELQARKTQYEYYRNQLLDYSEGEVEWKKLGDTCYMKSGKAISSNTIFETKTNDNLFQCFGGNGIRGYVSKYSHSGNYPIIGRQGALCGNINYASGEFYATEHAVVVKSKGLYLPRYLFYLLQNMNLNQYKSQGAQPGLAVGNIEEIFAPIPPLAEQERIVSILDQFDTLVNSITEGLPKEIALRQKQYEYYRNLLLTFPQKTGNEI